MYSYHEMICSDTLMFARTRCSCYGIIRAEYDFNRMLGECAREWYFMYSNGIVYLCVFEDKLFGVWYTDYVLEIPTAAQTRPRTVFFMPCIRAHSTCTRGDIFLTSTELVYKIYILLHSRIWQNLYPIKR